MHVRTYSLLVEHICPVAKWIIMLFFLFRLFLLAIHTAHPEMFNFLLVFLKLKGRYKSFIRTLFF